MPDQRVTHSEPVDTPDPRGPTVTVEPGDRPGMPAHADGARADARPAVVVALGAGLTQNEAARVAGVDERTVRRWLAEPAFRADVQRARLDHADETADLLRRGHRAAARLLLGQVEDVNEDPKVRQAAAVALLRTREAVGALDELERALAALLGRLHHAARAAGGEQ